MKLKVTIITQLLFTIGILQSNCYAQKIKISEFDKFQKSQRIETSMVLIKGGIYNAAACGYRSIGNTILFMIGGGGNYVVGGTSKIIILFSDDSTTEIISKGIQSSKTDVIQGAGVVSSYQFEYYIAVEQVEMLKNMEVKSIRMFETEEYIDFDLKKKHSADLKSLSTIFLEEYNKHLQN